MSRSQLEQSLAALRRELAALGSEADDVKLRLGALADDIEQQLDSLEAFATCGVIAVAHRNRPVAIMFHELQGSRITGFADCSNEHGNPSPCCFSRIQHTSACRDRATAPLA